MMMHSPSSLDESRNKDGDDLRGGGGGVSRQRSSSLDGLASNAPLRQYMGDDEDPDDFYKDNQPRRRSLNHNVTNLPTTFLATNMHTGNGKQQQQAAKQKDLDLDWHASSHSKHSRHISTSFGKAAATAAATSALGGGGEVSDDEGSLLHHHEDDEDDDDDDDSDQDSFCDASVQEQANKEYLRKDLGASCYWSSFDDDDGHDMGRGGGGGDDDDDDMDLKEMAEQMELMEEQELQEYGDRLMMRPVVAASEKLADLQEEEG